MSSWEEVKSEAFGEIGLLPDDFYRMETSDFNLLKKGYYRKLEYQQATLRKAVMIVIAPWVKQMPDAYKIWPLESDGTMLKEMKDEAMDSALANLNRLKKGEFIYMKVDGKIKEIPINNGRDSV